MAASLHKKAPASTTREPVFHMAYLKPDPGEAVCIPQFDKAASSSVLGAFKQLRMWRNVEEYGLDEGAQRLLRWLPEARP